MTAGNEQSLMSHLLELRQRLLYAVVAVLAVFLVGGLAGWRANTDDTRQMAKAHARSIVEASSR